MSGLHVYTVSWTNRALVAATKQTVAQVVTGSTRKAQVVSWGVFFDGVTSTAEPVDVFVVRQTGAGTSSAGNVDPMDPDMPAAISTTRITFTAEPTSDDTFLDRKMVHPQGGGYEKSWALGDPTAPVLDVSQRLGITCTAAAGVNCSGYIIFAE